MADRYWKGVTLASWGTASNWSTDLAGTINAGTIPGSSDIAYLTASSVSGARTVYGGATNRNVLGIIGNQYVSGGFTLLGGTSITTENITLNVGTSGIVSQAGAGQLNFGTSDTSRNVTVNGVGATFPISNQSSNTMTFEQSITNSVSGASNFQVSVTGTGDIVFVKALGVGYSSDVTLTISGNTNGGAIRMGEATGTNPYFPVTTMNSGWLQPNVLNLSALSFKMTGGKISSASTSSMAMSAYPGLGSFFELAGNIEFGDAVKNGPITVVGSVPITVSSATVLTVNSALTVDVAITLNANLSIATSAAVSLSRVVSGTGSLSKSGAGTLTLSGANTYSGGTPISAGTVRIATSSNSPFTSGPLGTSTITMTGGALSSDAITARTLANALSLNGTVTLGDANNTGALTFSGTTTIAGTTALYNDSRVFFSGTITGTASLTKSGNGIIDNTGTVQTGYSGAITVVDGVFFSNITTLPPPSTGNTFPNVATFTVTNEKSRINIQSNTDFTAPQTMSGSGIITVINKTGITTTFGTGALAGLTGTLDSFTLDGLTYAVGSGLTVFSSATAGQDVTNTIVAVKDFPYRVNFDCVANTVGTSITSRVSYTGSGKTYTNTKICLLSRNAAAQTYIATNATQVLAANHAGGTPIIIGGGVVRSGLPSPGNTATFTLDGTNTAANEISGAIAESTTGALALTKTGIGTWVLSGANTFTGTVSVTAGTLNANSATALGADTSLGTVTSGATLSLGAALNYSTRTFTISGTGVSTGGALVHAYAGTAKIGAITLGAAAYIRGTASGTSTLSSSIANGGFALTTGAASGNTLTLTGGISGLGGLVVGNSSSDTGTVALTTANTYQGNTTLSFGTLSLGNATALGSVGTLVFNGGTIDASSSVTIANALTVSAAITFAGTSALTLSAAMALGASRTVTTNGSGGALTLSGIISGATFKLTKAGTNTLKLTNANTYSGGTDIGAGIVQAGNTQALGTTGTVTLTASGAVLQTLTAGGQNGKLTVQNLTNTAGGTIRIGG